MTAFRSLIDLATFIIFIGGTLALSLVGAAMVGPLVP